MDDSKIDLGDIGRGVVGGLHMAYKRDQQSTLVNTVMNFCVQ
jgi:hypothetical protein